jgi:hypothetical protein
MTAWDFSDQVGGVIDGGFRIECGELTVAGASSAFPATQLHTLWGGLCACDLTDANFARISSICEGPTLNIVCTDSTGNTVVTWVAWGT